jgi:hypothetical protein
MTGHSLQTFSLLENNTAYFFESQLIFRGIHQFHLQDKRTGHIRNNHEARSMHPVHLEERHLQIYHCDILNSYRVFLDLLNKYQVLMKDPAPRMKQSYSSIVGSGIRLQAKRSHAQFPVKSLDFPAHLIIPAPHYGPGVTSASISTRNLLQNKGCLVCITDNLTAICELTV